MQTPLAAPTGLSRTVIRRFRQSCSSGGNRLGPMLSRRAVSYSNCSGVFYTPTAELEECHGLSGISCRQPIWVPQRYRAAVIGSVWQRACAVERHTSACTYRRARQRHRWRRRCLAQRACTARLKSRLLSSALTLRHRAAPRPTAVRRIGGGASFLLEISRRSRARSNNGSAARPVWRMTVRSRLARRTPSPRTSSAVKMAAGSVLADLLIH
jgi:hypothetical protein